MPPVSVLIKPVSGNCDLRCRYCFYADETEKRLTKNYGQMSIETLGCIVQRCLDYAERQCTFGFQGGEPTLRGLAFFEKLTDIVKKSNTKNVQINYTIQTNGMCIDRKWAEFFAAHGFLVGLSIDGNQHIHDSNRIDSAGRGTYSRAIRAAHLFEEYRVAFNILSVVTAQSSAHIKEIYRFFKNQGFLTQQYIPCMDPLFEPPCQRDYSLSPEQYSRFLIELFDEWFADRWAGRKIYIRYFENLAALMLGRTPDGCHMLGRCLPQLVVEADGSVYPCDFYMLDDYKLGNFATHSIAQLAESWVSGSFASEASAGVQTCADCEYYALCRGGCRRDRQGMELHSFTGNRFCAAYRSFFAHAAPKLSQLLRRNGHMI